MSAETTSHADVANHLNAVRMGLPFNATSIARAVWPVVKPVLVQLGMAAFRAVLKQLQEFADQFSEPTPPAATP